ncbi:Ribonuclease P [Handroanthus impetiginosus]|uniref:ribonuclease P n=1 Tax=Handroanthus impetiginosus TaxID=429701 RepID=A0A2G9HKU6_9LAMI|nr:Ribonuclease P [Handroanthus impetiginosus]
MASFTFKPLQQTQLQLSSSSHCSYSSTLNTFKFHLSFNSLTVLPPKHALKLQINVRVAAHSETRLSGDIAEELSRDNVNNGPKDDFPSGFSSFNDISRRAGRKSLERNHSGSEEHIERRAVLKYRQATVGLNSERRKNVGLGASSMRAKGNNLLRNTEKTGSSKYENNGVEGKQKEKRTKKPKVDSPGTTLRVGLDMCSKRGDVLGAIKLYGLARKEGIKMGQYHYAVLLYLCSSAATGVVQPAKSGNHSRSLTSVDPSNDNSVVGSESSSEFGEMVKMSYGRGKFFDQNLEGEPVEQSEKIDSDMDCVPAEVSGSDLMNFGNGSMEICAETVDGLVQYMKNTDNSNSKVYGSEGYGIRVSEDVKRVALQKGFEIYGEMLMEKVPMNEATFTSVARMAMVFGDGDMAFDVVKQMKEYGINPRLRSYGPALAIFCNNGDVENAFKVEKHMLEHGVHPEEPELEALLKAIVEAGKSDKVYFVLHKLRTTVRQVSPSTADLIERWFKSKVAPRGWLGKGKWTVCRSNVDSDGLCKSCGEKLVTIDLDPVETDLFAESLASIAAQGEKNSSFQKFQKWLDYYGPFEAVVDAANVGLHGRKSFKPALVNRIANGIRQMLPSRKWPLIILHNRRITGEKMDEPFYRSMIEKWKNADALYATPTGSNDDWYWLYAAIKFRCLIVTNDEMRDHLFQLLGNDFFPKWKERHQVRFHYTDAGPVFHMPPPCSVVIQESEKGHWHIPIVSGFKKSEDERIWLCCTRSNSSLTGQDSSDTQKESHPSHQKNGETRIGARAKVLVEPKLAGQGNRYPCKKELQELSKNVKTLLLSSVVENHASILGELEAAEILGGCVIDFQI